MRLRRKPVEAAPRRPTFVVDVEIASGEELPARLLAQGLETDEVIFKYFWPRYAPPADALIQSLVKSEHLGRQFERLVEMHQVVPSAVPLPVGTVRNEDGELVGYLLERVDGVTFRELVAHGALDEARSRLDAVERAVAKLHAKSLPHGDLNSSNVIAADDGRTMLIDPVATPGPGTALQDDLSLQELRSMVSPGVSGSEGA